VNEDLSPVAQALLEAVVVGDRPRDDETVREPAQREQAFELRLQQLDEVQELLEQTSDDVRRTRADARTLTGTPGEKRMCQSVGLPWRWSRLALLGGLAAAGIAAVLYFGDGGAPTQSGKAGDPIDPIYMGEPLWIEVVLLGREGRELDRDSKLATH